MERFAMLMAMAAMLFFVSPAMSQTSETTDADTPETTQPESAGQSQYQYDPDGPQIQQSVEEALEEAIEDAQENNAAADGTEAYLDTLSPDEAEAAETVEAEKPEESAPSASEKYVHLPDTGGANMLPLVGAAAILIAGGMLMRKVHTKSA